MSSALSGRPSPPCCPGQDRWPSHGPRAGRRPQLALCGRKITRRRGSSSRKTSSWTSRASGCTQAGRSLGPESERPNAGSRARARAAAQPWQPQEEDSGGRRLGRGVSRIRYGLKAWNLFQNRSSGAVLTSRGRRGQNSATVKKAPLLFLWHGRAGDLRQIRTKPSMRSTTQAPGPTP